MSDAIMIDTPEGIAAFRLLTIRSGLKMETRGMKLTRGPSCLSIVKREFGIKARTAAIALPQFEALLREQGILKDEA